MVAKTNFILRFNEASGGTITNYGSTASGDYTQANGGATDGVDYARLPASGPYLGRLQAITTSNVSVAPYWTTAAAIPPDTLQDINVMLGWNISNIPTTAAASRFVSANGIANNGDVYIEANTKSGSNYTINVRFYNAGAGHIDFSEAGKVFGTSYLLAASLNLAAPTVPVSKVCINGGSVTTTNGSSWASQLLRETWPQLNRRNDDLGTTCRGVIGYYHAYAYQRGVAVAWDDTALQAVSADPANIVGWSLQSAVPVFVNNYYR